MTAIAALYSDEEGLCVVRGGEGGGGRGEGGGRRVYCKQLVDYVSHDPELSPDWILFSRVSAHVEEQGF